MTVTARHDPAREFCSRFSQANRDDPIGSARIARHHLFIEVPFPWPKPFTDAVGMPAGVNEVLSDAQNLGVDLKVLGLKPDETYSHEGMTRVMMFLRPDPPLVTLHREEFFVPSEHTAALIRAMLLHKEFLKEFEAYRVDSEDVRDLMVCTHGSTDACCGTFGFPIYAHLHGAVAPNSTTPLRVWRTSHTGGHRFAPTMLDFPEGRYWGHLTREIAELIATRNGPVGEIYSAYRGWSALGSFEQLAEREVLMREGWSWLTYGVTGSTVVDEARYDEPAWLGTLDGAQVNLDYQSPDGRRAGRYEAVVRSTGTVQVAGCGKPPKREKAFAVASLKRVE